MTGKNLSAPPASVHSEFRAGWMVVLAAAVGVGVGVTGVNTYSLSVLLNPLSEAFGWARSETSAAKTFLTLGYVLTAPAIGYLADRFGPRTIGMVSLAGLAVGMIGMTQLSGSIEAYYLFYFVLALLGCATTPLVWTRAVATWFVQKRGLALGLALTGTGIAGIFTPMLIGGLIDRFGWQAGFVGMGALAALGLIPVFFFFFENSARAGSAKSPAQTALMTGFTVSAALRSRQFWQVSIAFAVIGGSISAVNVHLVALLTDSGISRDDAVSYVGLLGFAVVAGRLVTGYLVDHFHPPYIAGLILLLPAFGCASLAAGNFSPPAIIAAVLSVGIAAGSEVDLLPYLTARYFGLRNYGKIYGWVFVLFYAGVGLGPPFLGWMFERNGDYVAALMILGPLLAAGAAVVATLGRAPELK